MSKNQKIIILIASLIWIVIGFGLLNTHPDSTPPKPKEKDIQAKTQVEAPSQLPKPRKSEVDKAKETMMDRLEVEIKYINDGKFNTDKYTGSATDVLIAGVIFKGWAVIIEEAQKHNDDTIKMLAETLKNKATSVQKSAYPRLRKNYVDAIKHDLWLKNIEIDLSGSRNTYITLTSGVFANNQNKQDLQEQIYDFLNILRFKRITYKWYKYDDKATTYLVSDLDDEVIVSD